MKILCLYNNDCAIELFEWLRQRNHEIELYSEKLNAHWCAGQRFDLAVSYTYRHILTQDILSALNDNAVNIHNSYLPWNRGADPNIWSIIDDTPRGVTLHYMDSALDKGYIIAQKLLKKRERETLKSGYEELDRAAKDLFKEAFAFYKDWPQMKKMAVGVGTYHSLEDGRRMKSVIDTYEMPVVELKKRLQGMGG